MLIDHVITRKSRQLCSNTTSYGSSGAHVEVEFRASEVGDLPAAKSNIPTASGLIPSGAGVLSMTKDELYHNLMRIRSAQPFNPVDAQGFAQPSRLERQGLSRATAKPTSHADAQPEEHERQSMEMVSTGKEGLIGQSHDWENQRSQPRGSSSRGDCGDWAEHRLEPWVLGPLLPWLDKPPLEHRGRRGAALKIESELKGATPVSGNSLWDMEPDVNKIGFREGFACNKVPVLSQWDGEAGGNTRARQHLLLLFH